VPWYATPPTASERSPVAWMERSGIQVPGTPTRNTHPAHPPGTSNADVLLGAVPGFRYGSIQATGLDHIRPGGPIRWPGFGARMRASRGRAPRRPLRAAYRASIAGSLSIARLHPFVRYPAPMRGAVMRWGAICTTATSSQRPPG